MDLSQSIHLSSSDVVNALRAFFAMPVVNAVIAMLLALMLVTVTIPRMIGLVRWLAGYERGGDYEDDLPHGWGTGEYNWEFFSAPGADTGCGNDEWQGDVGRVVFGTPASGIDEFYYSTDPNSPYVDRPYSHA